MNYDILTSEIQRFIKDHEFHDPFQLILKSEYNDLPIKDIAAQIQSRQKAKDKIPEWLQTKNVYFPPQLSIEQCSSEKAAKYKANLLKVGGIVDLTGGVGVDAFYFSKKIPQVVYVEKNGKLSEIARHNFKVLGAENITVETADSQIFLNSIERVDLIYIDPSRRTGKRVFRLEESEPNVIEMIDVLLKKADNILVKTSPLLDIDRACKQLKKVAEAHVVSIRDECKEVLYLLNNTAPAEPNIFTVNLLAGKTDRFDFFRSDEKNVQPIYGEPGEYIYEPNASIMKAGAFKSVAVRYDLKKLHSSSHLYTADHLKPDFPGRMFKISKVFTFNRKALKQIAGQTKSINIIARNFPLSSEEIKRQTGLRDGGEEFLIFTTNSKNQKIIVKAIRVI